MTASALILYLNDSNVSVCEYPFEDVLFVLTGKYRKG